MRTTLVAIAATLLIISAMAASGATRRARPVRGPHELLPAVHSLLWIGAHPDDEVLAAPLLAELCIREHVACTFLVLTRGEAGVCLLPAGCGSDLGAFRTIEMGRAAALFGAQLEMWNLPDGAGQGDGTAPRWDEVSGSHEALVSRIADFVTKVHPDIVLTFDPRHGSTCHPDHRATGNLVVEALPEDGSPVLYLLESTVNVTENPLRAMFSVAAPDTGLLFRFDGTSEILPDETGWDLLLDDMASHPSQFDASWLAAAAANPPENRATWFGWAAAMLARDDVFSCR